MSGCLPEQNVRERDPSDAHQLTESDRAVLAELLTKKLPKREIARQLGKHHSTIYREFAVNTGPVGYVYQEAEQRTDIIIGWGGGSERCMIRRVRKYVCRQIDRSGRRTRLPAGWSWSAPRCTADPSRQTIYAWIRTARRKSGTAGVVACVLELHNENAEPTQAAPQTPSGSNDSAIAHPAKSYNNTLSDAVSHLMFERAAPF